MHLYAILYRNIPNNLFYMEKNKRIKQILAQLKQDKQLNTIELSKQLEVSDDTIRRDLIELEKKGFLIRVHGGAVSKSLIPLELEERMTFQQASKIELAKKVIPYLHTGQVLFIDGGTTNLEVARQINNNLHLKVFTNSLPLATLLCNHAFVEIEMLGGSILKSSQVAIGANLLDTISYIRPDIYIMGIASEHPEFGLSVPSYEESLVKRKMLQQAHQTIVPILTTKRNTMDKYKVCSFEAVDVLLYED